MTDFTLLKGLAFAERYQLQQQLGKKPGRYTFLARDTVNNNLVVIKLFNTNLNGIKRLSEQECKKIALF
jgi:hypothetical protein